MGSRIRKIIGRSGWTEHIRRIFEEGIFGRKYLFLDILRTISSHGRDGTVQGGCSDIRKAFGRGGARAR